MKYFLDQSEDGEFGVEMGNRKVMIAIALGVTVAFFGAAFAYGYWSSDGWYVENVEAYDETAYGDLATALDGSGSLHAVFCSLDGHDWGVRHAVRTDGDWEISTITASSKAYGFDISVDPTSEVRVTWCESGEGFSYAHGTSAGFDIASAEIDDFDSGATATAADGTVHGLCAIQRFNATWPSHWEWEFQHWVVSSTEWVLAGTYGLLDDTYFPRVLALIIHGDEDPIAVVSYQSDSADVKFYALAEVTDSGLDIGDPFIWGSDYVVYDTEMDSQGAVHIVGNTGEPMGYFDHLYQDGENWEKEDVDWAGDSSWTDIDLLIDDDDDVYLTYVQRLFGVEVDRLKVAHRDDGGWDFKTLESGHAFLYDRPSFAVGPDGVYHVVHFVYEGWNENALTYANTDSGDIFTSELMSAALWTALAVAVGAPTAFAGAVWHSKLLAERRRKQELERMGLFEDNLKKVR